MKIILVVDYSISYCKINNNQCKINRINIIDIKKLKNELDYFLMDFQKFQNPKYKMKLIVTGLLKNLQTKLQNEKN